MKTKGKYCLNGHITEQMLLRMDVTKLFNAYSINLWILSFMITS